MAGKIVKRITIDFTEARGRQLAVDMMREIGEHWGREIPDDVPDDQITEWLIDQEPEIMRRYLATVQRGGSAALERGFLCVLTDFIGGELNGAGCVSLEAYARRW